MLKNNSLLSVVYGVLVFLILGAIFLSLGTQKDNSIIFSYPDEIISFAGEAVPFYGNSINNKERFDKEFLGTSNNLYQFFLYVKRYPLYVPEIEEKLKVAGIPDDFKYLPIAESALRNDVVSSAGAAGIWQFMPDTARRFGLQVDEHVDERYHFEKATDAAIEYLNILYDKFGDWTLVAAAYNRGENGLQRALDNQGVDNYYDLYLNEETSRYVFRILAIKYVVQSYFNKKEFVDRLIGGVHESPEVTIVRVSEIPDLAQWALENNYKYKDVRILNRWIIGDSLPMGEWDITILKN